MRKREKHYIITGESIYQKGYIAILNVYAPKKQNSKYMKQKKIET